MAHEAIRKCAESAWLVNRIGTRAPNIIPAVCAPPRYSSCLAGIWPDSRLGTARISTLHATTDLMPLILAAASDTAFCYNRVGPRRLQEQVASSRF